MGSSSSRKPSRQSQMPSRESRKPSLESQASSLESRKSSKDTGSHLWSLSQKPTASSRTSSKSSVQTYSDMATSEYSLMTAQPTKSLGSSPAKFPCDALPIDSIVPSRNSLSVSSRGSVSSCSTSSERQRSSSHPKGLDSNSYQQERRSESYAGRRLSISSQAASAAKDWRYASQGPFRDAQKLIFHGVVSAILPSKSSRGHHLLPDNAARTLAYFESEFASTFDGKSRAQLIASLEAVTKGLKVLIPALTEVGVDGSFFERMVERISILKHPSSLQGRNASGIEVDLIVSLDLAYDHFHDQQFLAFGKDIGKLAKLLGRTRYEALN